MTTTQPDTRTDLLRFPTGFLWGAATAAYQIEGAVTERRPHPLDLGHLRAHARPGRGRRHRRRGRGPLPPLPRGRRPHGRPRAHRLPLLGGVAADHAARHRRGAGPGQRGGPRLLLRPGRRAARRGHRTRGHALPLGPAAGPRRRGRLDEPGDRRAVRRVRRRRGGRARRPGRPLLHGERAVVLGLPRLRQRRARARPHRRRGRAHRRAPPQPGARPRRRRGAGRRARARRWASRSTWRGCARRPTRPPTPTPPAASTACRTGCSSTRSSTAATPPTCWPTPRPSPTGRSCGPATWRRSRRRSTCSA